MTHRPIITLTTDFGSADTYVAQVKGAILAVSAEARIVDVTHDVPPHDIDAGGYLLWTAADVFPDGTIHVAVVDPGVGGSRRGIAVRNGRFVFVAPDNGILTRVLEADPPGEAVVLEEEHYRRPAVSPTFHGRDVFAPAAAWIARGIALSNLGPPAERLESLARKRVRLDPGVRSRVRVLWVDRFGNVTLDLPAAAIGAETDGEPARRLVVATANGSVARWVRTFSDAPPGEPALLFNSAAQVEIVVRMGRASDCLGLKPGDEVEAWIEFGETRTP